MVSGTVNMMWQGEGKIIQRLGSSLKDGKVWQDREQLKLC